MEKIGIVARRFVESVKSGAKCSCGALIAAMPTGHWHPPSMCETCFYKLPVEQRRLMANGRRKKL